MHQLATWFFTTFTASDIKGKVHSLKGVQYLYSKMGPDQIDVPTFVQEHDIKVGRNTLKPAHSGQMVEMHSNLPTAVR